MRLIVIAAMMLLSSQVYGQVTRLSIKGHSVDETTGVMKLLTSSKKQNVYLDCHSFLNGVVFKDNKDREMKSFMVYHNECMDIGFKIVQEAESSRPLCLLLDWNSAKFAFINQKECK